ncbi:hypothetical protein HPB47_019880, partial [Ixodes persulcatus]
MFVQLQANVEAAEGTRVPKVLPQGPPTPHDPTGGGGGGDGAGPQHACQQHQPQQHQRRTVGAAEGNGAASAPESESDAPEASQPAKKKTAGDLVKEVEVQGSEDPEEAGVDMEEDLDDDELLGLGNDFNILEYADPELDRAFVGEGEKSNILDEHLDLDDKEDDLDEVGRAPDAEVKEEDACSERAASGAVGAKHGPDDIKEKGSPLGPMGMRGPPGLRGALGSGAERPLLLQEQPLLLEDLVEQEKREQRKQGAVAGGGDGVSPGTASLLSDVDFERLKADVLSGPPDDTIGGPPTAPAPLLPPVPQQHSVNPAHLVASPLRYHHMHQGGPGPWPPPAMLQGGPQGTHMLRQPPAAMGALVPPGGAMHLVRPDQGAIRMMGVPPHRQEHMAPGTGAPSGSGQGSVVSPSAQSFQIQTLPSPPVPSLAALPVGGDPEQQRQQQQAVAAYEQWLAQQDALLASQRKFLETEVGKLRKAKKALTTKQRQLAKSGQELPQHNALELLRIGQEQPGLQKQLEQVRKLGRQHTLVLQEYRAKQQKRQQQLQQQQGSPLHQGGLVQQGGPLQQGASVHHMGPGMTTSMPSGLGPNTVSNAGPGMGQNMGPNMGPGMAPNMGVSTSGGGMAPLGGPPQSPMPPPSSPMGGPSPSPRMQQPPTSPLPVPSPLLSQMSPQLPSPRTPRPPNVHPLSQTAEARAAAAERQLCSRLGGSEARALACHILLTCQYLPDVQPFAPLAPPDLVDLSPFFSPPKDDSSVMGDGFQHRDGMDKGPQQQQMMPSIVQGLLNQHSPHHEGGLGVPHGLRMSSHMTPRPFQQHDQQQHILLHPRFPGQPQMPRYLIRQGSDPASQHPPGHPYLQRTGGVHPMMRPPPPYPDHLRKPPPSPAMSPGHGPDGGDNPDPSRTPPSLSRPNSQPALPSPDPRSSPMERHFSPGTPSSSSSLPQRSPAVPASLADDARGDVGERSVESLSDLLSRVSKTPSESPSPQSRGEEGRPSTGEPSPGRGCGSQDNSGQTPPLSKQESILQYLRAGSVGSPASNSNSSRGSVDSFAGVAGGQAMCSVAESRATESPHYVPASVYQSAGASPVGSPSPSAYTAQSQSMSAGDAFASDGSDSSSPMQVRTQMGGRAGELPTWRATSSCGLAATIPPAQGGGLPGGRPHTVGGGRGAVPASPPKASSSSGDEGEGASSTPSLLHRAGEGGSSSFGGSTFHVGPSSTLVSFETEQMQTSVFVSLDYPAATITSHDGCVSSEVLLSLDDGSADAAALAPSEDEEDGDASRVALVVVGDGDGGQRDAAEHGEPLDVAVVVETVGALSDCDPADDGSSPGGSDGADGMAPPGCGELHQRGTPAGDHNYSNPPPEGADEDVAKKLVGRTQFFDGVDVGIKLEDPVLGCISEEKPNIEKLLGERITPPQRASKTPSPPAAPVATSAMSFPASVTHTLNFTLRQTGMPQTVRLSNDEGQLVVLPAKAMAPQLSLSPPAAACEPPVTPKMEPASAPTPPAMLRVHAALAAPPSLACGSHAAALRWCRTPPEVKEEGTPSVPLTPPPTLPPVVVKQEARSTPSPCLAACHKQESEDVEEGSVEAADTGASRLTDGAAVPRTESNSCDDGVPPEQRLALPVTPPVAMATHPVASTAKDTAAALAAVKVEPTVAAVAVSEAQAGAVEEAPAPKACEGSVEGPDGPTGGKQNVLLKQLLQNCPSAETPHVADLPEDDVKDDILEQWFSTIEVSRMPCGSAEMMEDPIRDEGKGKGGPTVQTACSGKSENGTGELSQTASLSPSLPSSPSSQPATTTAEAAVTTTAVPASTPGNELDVPAAAAGTPESQTVVGVAGTQAGATATADTDKPEESKVRKMTYLGERAWTCSRVLLRFLDIRRAQLEREPTPPPPTAEDLALRRQQQRKRPKKPKAAPSAPEAGPGGPPGSDAPRPAAPGGARAKRPRKGSRGGPEEDYELFLEALLGRLRALPPVRILEPLIRPNFNVGAVFGRGDLNLRESSLKGSYGRAFLPGQPDAYSVCPFGDRPPPPVAPSSAATPSPTPLRGFYNQEFSVHARVTSGGADSNRCREADSPDTIVGASSPECAMFEAPFRFRGLQLIDEDSNDSARSLPSPTVPIVAPIPVKAIPPPPPPPPPTTLKSFTDEKDKENAFSGDRLGLRSRLPGCGGPPPAPLRDSANVSVTLTLSSEAATDIRGVLCSLAKLLQIEPPSSYDIVERTSTPPSQKLGLYKHNNKDVTLEEEAEYLVDGKQRFCRHCEIMVSQTGMVKKQASELGLEATISREDGEATVVCHAGRGDHPCREAPDSSRDRLARGVAAAREVVRALGEDDEASPAPKEEEEEEEEEEGRLLGDLELSPAGEELRKRAPKHSLALHGDQEPTLKKWKDVRWKLWSVDFVGCTKYEPPSEEEVARLLDAQDICVKPDKPVEDTRRCILCHVVGDGETNGPARLLNLDVDMWVHLNCALWSQEVYETVNGALMNVASACRRAVLLTCCCCQRTGASLRCFRLRCTAAYHFPCAAKDGCSFFKDKTILCPQHTPRVPNLENVLESVAVFRRVYINRDEHKQVASMIHKGEQNLLRVGSLIFLSVGQLLPHQLQSFHTPNCIYP